MLLPSASVQLRSGNIYRRPVWPELTLALVTAVPQPTLPQEEMPCNLEEIPSKLLVNQHF